MYSLRPSVNENIEKTGDLYLMGLVGWRGKHIEFFSTFKALFSKSRNTKVGKGALSIQFIHFTIFGAIGTDYNRVT